MFYNI